MLTEEERLQEIQRIRELIREKTKFLAENMPLGTKLAPGLPRLAGTYLSPEKRRELLKVYQEIDDLKRQKKDLSKPNPTPRPTRS